MNDSDAVEFGYMDADKGKQYALESADDISDFMNL